ncbi:oxidation resistance protein 1 [Geranomyces michiganensis]|nr:oxidation resistance protein 1 [Geranomyces michiganensis]
MVWPFTASSATPQANAASRETLEDSFHTVHQHDLFETGPPTLTSAPTSPPGAGPLPTLRIPSSSNTASATSAPPVLLRASEDARPPGATPVEPFPPSLSGFLLEMLGVSSPTLSDPGHGALPSPKQDLSEAFGEADEFEEITAPVPPPSHPQQPRNQQPRAQPVQSTAMPPRVPVLIPANVTRVASYPPSLSQSAPDASPPGISIPQSPPTQTPLSSSLNSAVRSSLDSLFRKGNAAVAAVTSAVKDISDDGSSSLLSASSLDSSMGSLLHPSPFDEIRKPVVLSGRTDETEAVLVESMAGQLRPFLPPLLRESPRWKLLYSMEQHGISLNTLYQRCAPANGEPVLLAIKDSQGCVFGAFGSEAFRVQAGYYGTGACFLWKCNPETMEVTAYPATGKNDYLMLSEPHYIAMGGGEGHFGLWVDDQLYNGHSGPCQTFENERLSSRSEFEVEGLEVWSFQI